MRRRGLLAAPAMLPAPAARAQAWPSRPITLIVASPAGGGTDFAARLITEPLGQRLGQSVIVENRPGAAGTSSRPGATSRPRRRIRPGPPR